MTRPFIQLEKVYKKFQLKRPRKTAFSFLHTNISKILGSDISKNYWALEDINLRIEPGQKIGLIGNNGAGKTTLLKIIGGLYTPTAGSVTTKGEIRLFVSFGVELADELTVGENIYLYGAMCGLTENYIKQKLNEILEYAELQEFVYSKVKTLSAGMAQRLSFSVATHVMSDILLFDESLTMSDKDFRAKSEKTLENYKKSEIIIVMASHNLRFLADFCEKILWLDKGRQIAFGPARHVIEQYQHHISKGPI